MSHGYAVSPSCRSEPRSLWLTHPLQPEKLLGIETPTLMRDNVLPERTAPRRGTSDPGLHSMKWSASRGPTQQRNHEKATLAFHRIGGTRSGIRRCDRRTFTRARRPTGGPKPIARHRPARRAPTDPRRPTFSARPFCPADFSLALRAKPKGCEGGDLNPYASYGASTSS